jgi:ribosomal protein S18 acetylase RimI-like enzyme
MHFPIHTFDPQQHTDGTIQLWVEGFGYGDVRNAPRLSIRKKMEVNDGLFFVALQADQVIGTIMAGYDGHRGWLYSLAVSPSFRNHDIGTELVLKAEQALIQLGCTKINLQILESNGDVQGFYQKLGYQTEPRICMGKEITENIP